MHDVPVERNLNGHVEILEGEKCAGDFAHPVVVLLPAAGVRVVDLVHCLQGAGWLEEGLQGPDPPLDLLLCLVGDDEAGGSAEAAGTPVYPAMVHLMPQFGDYWQIPQIPLEAEIVVVEGVQYEVKNLVERCLVAWPFLANSDGVD